MIGLDTGVLVRYIVRDEAKQSAAATRLIESRCTADNPGLVRVGDVLGVAPGLPVLLPPAQATATLAGAQLEDRV